MHSSTVCGINQGFLGSNAGCLALPHAAKSLINGNQDKNPYNGECSASKLSSMRHAESCL